MDSYNPSLSPFSIFLSDQLTNRPNDAFPWIVLTLLERLFNDFLLITVYCTEFLYFFT